METTGQLKARRKTFTYETNLNWLEGKAGMQSSTGKQSFRVASPPEFRGEAGVWTPEELYLASVESCHMATFVTFAARNRLPLVSYQSEAKGTLEFIDGHYRFTRIVIFPRIVVASPAQPSDVHALISESHKHCIIANSINTIIEVNPIVSVQETCPEDLQLLSPS